MNIKKLCEDAHKNAVEKGFYCCRGCSGNGTEGTNGAFITCETCGGTGINPNKNKGELLALICSELYEALEAHRCGFFSDFKNYEKEKNWNIKEAEKLAFEDYIKDTFEDEIADVFIRLFDLCGYLNIEPKGSAHTVDLQLNALEQRLSLASFFGEDKGDE